MESRIILSQADFSANNIGQYVELNDLTKKVLAKQTQYGEDSTEARALNTFLQNLTNDGFIGGSDPLLTFLAIPALANSHDEMLYNIASLDASGYPLNTMALAETSAEHKVYGLVKDANNRVVGFKNDYDAEATFDTQGLITIDKAIGTIGGTIPSLSIATYYIKTIGENRDIFRSVALNIQFNLTSSKFGITQNSTFKLYSELSNSILGFNGFSYDATQTKIEGISDNATIGETVNDGFSSSLPNQDGTTNKFKFGGNSPYDTVYSAAAMLLIGNYINPTKMAALQGYVDSLMTALHVKSYIQNL